MASRQRKSLQKIKMGLKAYKATLNLELDDRPTGLIKVIRESGLNNEIRAMMCRK